MRTPLVLLAATAAVLLPAGSAAAKEIGTVRACGADGCHDVTARASQAMLEGGSVTIPPSHAAPFYRIRVTIRGEGARATFTNLYVPSAQMVRGDEGWMSPPTTAVRVLDRVVRGIQPIPAGRLSLPKAADEPDSSVTGAAVPPASSPPSGGDGLPAAVWVFLASGVAGLLAAVAAVARNLRRGGSAAAG